MGETPSTRKGTCLCSLRYGLAIIMHFSNFTMITQRVSLSIAIIAMVNSTEHARVYTEQPNASTISTVGLSADTQKNSSKSFEEFHTGPSVYEWNPETQGIIFSSINYGILLTLIPSGYLAGIFGAKHMLGAGLLISSLLTIFTPLAANFGVILVIVVRTVQGMAQGMAWTGQFTIWAKWAPPLERSKLTSIAGSGVAFGSFIILCVGGLISQALGWPFIFYIFGSTGCVCCLLWFTLIYDDPMHHPCISSREQKHITSSLAQQPSSPRRSVPIKAMVRCLPLWAIFMGFFSHFWLCTIIITYLPTYISSVLHVNIKDNGVLSSLPFIAASSCTILGGQLADFLLSRNLLRLITVRKLFSSLGLLLPSLCAMALPFVASSNITTIILLILIPGTSNLCDSGFIINTLDIAPRYSSFLMGISRGFGLIAGIISSTATGFIISQNAASGWKNVFFLSAAVNMFGLVFYLVFGQAKIQGWAKEENLTRL
ncbi:sodium-dependent phosphate transport protein 3 [Tenrec ecaudatus]|uniref:sodium-dependent phosphate transport protein 3 n=1 Tax=Tenrec ecaudatus TaxID=94439 RepID=UPI003F5A808A